MARPRAPKKSTEISEAVASAQPISTTTGSAAAAAPAREVQPKPEKPKTATKKPEIVRSETPANLVPINLDHEIRQLAYLRSERRGFEPGHETEDWLAAEREVRQRYQQHSA